MNSLTGAALSDILGIIVIIFFIAIVVFLIWGIVQIAFAFNMTDDLIEEERQLELCINWKIENKSCSQIYGGIDGSNGEPLR